MDDRKGAPTAPTIASGLQSQNRNDTCIGTSVSGVIRRRNGLQQGLRSPAAKRPFSAPVTLQGWLHKQGSEGLMLWKKRWFVLSEYCMFYYKGPEEEKLLGSILLPSYRVTICEPEEKVNKKFAFKAEHANMRTYFFAADSREGLNQWVNVLTLATLLQDPTPGGPIMVGSDLPRKAHGHHNARPSVSSMSSILNHSTDDSDSGFHGFQSRDDPSNISNNNPSPNSSRTAPVACRGSTNSNNVFVGMNENPKKDGSDHIVEDRHEPFTNGWIQPPGKFGGHQDLRQKQYEQSFRSPGQQHYHQQQQQQQQFLHQQQIDAHQMINSYQQPKVHQHIKQSQHVKLRQHQHQAGLINVQSIQPGAKNFGHSLYANAPPKPRRFADGSIDYSTNSPDIDHHPFSILPTNVVAMKTDLRADCERGNTIDATKLPLQQHQVTLRTDKSGINYGYNQGQPAERRTPDTYGRSGKPRVAAGEGDYEDVYTGSQLYKRPIGPVGYTKSPGPVPIPVPMYVEHQQSRQPGYFPGLSPNAPTMKTPKQRPPPRPHSADFLDYEVTRRPKLPNDSESYPTNQQRRPQRPKSSLDVVNSKDTLSSEEHSLHSEERESIQSGQPAVHHNHTPQEPQRHLNPPSSPEDRISTVGYSLRGQDTDNNNSVSVPETTNQDTREFRKEYSHEQHRMNMQSLQRYTKGYSKDSMLRRSLREVSYDQSESRDSLIRADPTKINHRTSRDPNFATTGPRMTNDNLTSPAAQNRQVGNIEPRHWREQQLARSASARLPRMRYFNDRPDSNEYAERTPTQNSQDGERRIQQREESMKRLIEWKQRMLHSPLTRKPGAALIAGGVIPQTEISSYYKRQALLDLAAHEAMVAEARRSRRREDGHRPHLRSKSTDSQRSAATNVSRYNSYSSDDEELDDVRRKRARKPPYPGRSARNFVEESATATTSVATDGTIAGQVSTSTGRANCHHQVTFLTQKSSARPKSSDDSYDTSTSLRRPTGSISPSAGYEEISFPPTCNKAYTISICSNRQTGSLLLSPGESLSVTTPKKPSGILKSATTYPTNRQTTNDTGISSSSGDYGSAETWQYQKNVQFDSADDQQNWFTKIDESKVIKEFSYQYIKSDDRTTDMKNECDDQTNSTETKNLVQSRIRSFESSFDGSTPIRQNVTMPETQKLSTSTPIDATQVSVLDPSQINPSNIRESPFNETPDNMTKLSDAKVGDDAQAYMQQIIDNGKSVKDLLADFERKSQKAKRKENERNDEVMHRRVFSDTETLLYDTESDMDQRDEGEDELYQMISKQCEDNDDRTDTMKKSHGEAGDKRNRAKTSNGKETSDSPVPDDFYTSSNTESYPRHGTTESKRGVDYSDDITMPSADSDIENINLEEHYLPMTPRKAILDPNNDDRPDPKIMESLFANLHGEESSYVEMAQNGMRHSLLAPNADDEERESGDYSILEARHYEFVRVSDMMVEPVYMEVNQLADKTDKLGLGTTNEDREANGNNDRGQTQTDLSDILTARKSDSSDADDESSRDLESIDAPRHPRFSLSDTFRPASYYLGASRVMIAELHDSSDSELVSPPPIPSSPPPLDELDSLNIQEPFDEKQMPPQAAMNQDNVSMQSSQKSWSVTYGQSENRVSPSRFSEPTASSTSRDSRLSIESAPEGDQMDLRNSDDEARHRQLKRRPVSNEVCEVLASLDKFESLGNRFANTGIDLDEYLEELQARDAFNVDIYAKDLSYNSIYGFNENRMVADKLQKPSTLEMASKINVTSNNSLDRSFQYDGRGKAGSASSLPTMKVSDAPPAHQHSQSFTGDAHYENLVTGSPLRGSPAIHSDNEPSLEFRASSINCRASKSSGIAHSRDSSSSLVARGTSGFVAAPYDRRNSTLSPAMGSPVGSSGQMPNYRVHQNHVRSSSHDTPRNAMSPIYRPSSCQDSTFYPDSASTPAVTQRSQMPSTGFRHFEAIAQPQQTHASSERDQNTAPYYYSDLQINATNTDEHLNNFLIGHTSRLPQLNNQRVDSSVCPNKRNDIGRLVNQITQQLPRPVEVEDIDESRLIAAALRMSSSQYFVEKRTGQVDRKNVYEADTLRRAKSTDPVPDELLPDINTVNLYPLGLRNKSNSQTNLAPGNISPDLEQTTQASHRRSRSLEGLLNNVELQNLVEQRKRDDQVFTMSENSRQVYEEASEIAAGVTEFPSTGVDGASGFGGEDPWEQDTLWRESLRRVSLRQARSLDNLDNSARSIDIVQQDSKIRPKITRGATYVNDSVVLQKHQRHASPEERAKRRSNERKADTGQRSEEPDEDEDDPYESLVINHRLTRDYVWDPENEAYRRQSSTDQHNQSQDVKSDNHFLSQDNLPPVASVGAKNHIAASTAGSFELDREKLRQWDLVSSACLLQEQQRTSMAESARGLPIFEDPRRLCQSVEATEKATKMMNETSSELKKRRSLRTIEDGSPFAAVDRNQTGLSATGCQGKPSFDRNNEESRIEEDR